MTCEQNALYQITKDNKKLHIRWQKEPGKTTEQTSGCVRPGWVKQWLNSMSAT
jgi:hypothetical protein